MNYYYAQAKESIGPVEAYKLHDLAARGTISGDTLVWAEGMENWQPYKMVFPDRQIGEPAPPPEAPIAPQSTGQPGPAGTTIDNPYSVAPSLTQMPPGSPELGDLIERPYKVEIGRLFGLAWSYFSKDFWLLMGAGAVMSLIHSACSNIPFLGIILSFLYLPFYAGAYFYYVRYIRAENPPFETIFSGFSRLLGQTILLNIMYAAVAILCFLPAGALAAGGAIIEQEALFILAALAAIIGIIVMLAVFACWFFSVFLVIDKGLSFSQAISVSWQVVRKDFWRTLAFSLLLNLVGFAGILLCLMGIFVTIPFSMFISSLLYEQTFGKGLSDTNPVTSNAATQTPNNYGS